MRWQHKAKIMKFCSKLPIGGHIYRQIQKTFGRLNAKPMARIPTQIEMAKWILASGQSLVGKLFFEIGTGHVPLAPIGFFLCGAQKVITVDLNRRIEWGLTQQCLEWIVSHRNEVASKYHNIVAAELFDERFAILSHYQNNPTAFFKEAGIEYLAPMDAADTHLLEKSIDYHFSITTLEHIPQAIINDIFTEAKRILKPNGLAVHFVDLSDHFQHQDPSITKVNFLSYNQHAWQRIAENEFGYCNRLRGSDFIALFQQLDLEVDRYEIDIDQESLFRLQSNEISLDQQFISYTPEDICTTSLKILLNKNSNRIPHKRMQPATCEPV
jgi:hypothetical protein